MITTSQTDILDDVLLYSYSDYIAPETQLESFTDSGSLETPPTRPPCNTKSVQMKPVFANIVFSDYENSLDTENTLAGHFQKSFAHSFSSSSLEKLGEWERSQTY
ncbi:hypothetical protein EIN_391550 [Entamoeba invadens IP1]|uniref:Uncharacterized protein n=1 Tax=Entamoeba invadens IP1 TaxID=370355 RepID=A0A0A1U5B4_ENTIV|nr:hypothetical protein EIN_391550 [Entamoeba invadens IP1]ELP89500.1 hypothetical protein EIN_391550 [Entamoeba invadens IP1]|eukprot:XP_004256271.1 hypothetical protein EIN_391550 [Entamoeba invadens IP1]